MSSVLRELIFAVENGKILRLDAPPRDFPEHREPSTPQDWAWIYGGMLSYESAIDAAGYATEAAMLRATSGPKVILASIDAVGSISGSFHGKPFQFSASEIFEQHQKPMPGSSFPYLSAAARDSLMWMGGNSDAARQGMFQFGPDGNMVGVGSQMKDGDVLIGKDGSGETVEVLLKVEGRFERLENGLDDLTSKAESLEP